MKSLTRATHDAFNLGVCFPCVSWSDSGYKLLNTTTWIPQIQELEFGEWDIPQLYVVGLLVVSEAGGTARDIILTLLSADSLILWLMNSVISSKGVLSWCA